MYKKELNEIIGEDDYNEVQELFNSIFGEINLDNISDYIENQEIISFIDKKIDNTNKVIKPKKIKLKIGNVFDKIFSNKKFILKLLKDVNKELKQFVETDAKTKLLYNYLNSFNEKEKIVVEIIGFWNNTSFFNKAVLMKLHKFYEYEKADNIQVYFNSFIEAYSVIAENYYKSFIQLLLSCENVRKNGGKRVRNYYGNQFGSSLDTLKTTLPKKYSPFILENSVLIRNSESHSHTDIDFKKEKLIILNKTSKGNTTLTVFQANKEIQKLMSVSFRKEILFVILYFILEQFEKNKVYETYVDTINNKNNDTKEKLEKSMYQNQFLQKAVDYENYKKSKMVNKK